MTHKAIYMKRIILGSSLLFCALFTAPAMHAQELSLIHICANKTAAELKKAEQEEEQKAIEAEKEVKEEEEKHEK